MTSSGIKVALALALAVSCAGCGTIKQAWNDDRFDNGGLVGHYGDRALRADNAKMELLRATLVFAMVSQAADFTLKDPYELSSYNTYMAGEDDAIQKGRKLLAQDCTSLSYSDQTKLPDGCKATFEANTIYLEQRMIPLIKAALPGKQAQKLISDVAGQNLWGAASDLVSFGKDLVVDVHAGDSALRSGYVILAKDIVDPDNPTHLSTAKAKPDQITAPAEIPGDILDRTTGAFTVPRGFTPNDWDFRALYAIIQNACNDMHARMPSGTKAPSFSCAFQYGDAPADPAKPAPVAAVGPLPGVVNAG